MRWSARPRLGRLAARGDVPAAALAIVLFGVMAGVQPSVLTASGLDLTLLGIVPLAFASVAQMIVMVGGDIDLSLGSALGLVNAICATELTQHAWVGAAELIGFVVGYVLMGAVIELRRLPSIIVTFAFGFIWLGFALVVLPTPGGTVPAWMTQLFAYSLPGIPEPILLLVVLGGIAWMYMFSTRIGKLIRTLGNRRLSVQQFAHRPVTVRLVMYFSASIAIVLGGFALSADSASGDPNAGQSYLLMSVAAVIIGGGDFAGGTSWPIGTVFGAIALGFVSSLDSFLLISANLVFALQGLLLILALGMRRIATVRARGGERNEVAALRNGGMHPRVERQGAADRATVASEAGEGPV